MFVLDWPEVEALKVRFRIVAKKRGVTATTLWKQAEKEFGFRNYNIPRQYADRVLAWIDAREPTPSRLDRLLGDDDPLD